jgi:uncharacterized protein YecE (DUF72 family)
MAAEIRIGCSGWQYRHWRGDFYPADLAQARWLEFYAARFDTVELNNSFYRLPSADAFASWARRSPSGFRFAVKASRYLTHLRKLHDPAEPLELLWSRAARLGGHLGPMLYQLPPHWHRDVDRLRTFLESVPEGRAQAVEFRDPTWYEPGIFSLLADHEVALCLHDMRGSSTPMPPASVGPLVYIRFHGSGRRYGGRYPDDVLRAWAERLVAWAEGGLPCWAYFNNDVGGHAPRDAVRLRELVYSAKNGSSP